MASKKKSKNEKAKAIAETTKPETLPNDDAAEHHVLVNEHTPENVNLADYPEILENEDQPKFEEAPATAYLAQNVKTLTYVFAMSHGGGAQKNDFTGRLPNVLLALVMFSLLATANGQQCEKGDEKEEGVEHLWMWLAILALIHIVVMTGIYMAGRWSCTTKELAPKPKTKEAEIQKDEPIG